MTDRRGDPGTVRDAGAAAYHGEAVSQAEHALQAAELAEREGAPDALVVAALLHDVGHLLDGQDEDLADARRRRPPRGSRLRLAVAALRPRGHRADPPARRRQAIPLRRRSLLPGRPVAGLAPEPDRSRAAR